MQSNLDAPAPRRQSGRARELAVIGAAAILLVVIGAANLRAARRDSAALVCLSNMRAIMRGASVYAGDHALAGASLDVAVLAQAGVVTQRVGHCPLSTSPGPDYVVTLREGRPVSIVCAVAPHLHSYLPEPAPR